MEIITFLFYGKIDVIDVFYNAAYSYKFIMFWSTIMGFFGGSEIYEIFPIDSANKKLIYYSSSFLMIAIHSSKTDYLSKPSVNLLTEFSIIRENGFLLGCVYVMVVNLECLT